MPQQCCAPCQFINWPSELIKQDYKDKQLVFIKKSTKLNQLNTEKNTNAKMSGLLLLCTKNH